MYSLMIAIAGLCMTEHDATRVLFDFSSKDSAKDWLAVNDSVMGGVSRGEFRIIDAKTLEFFGSISLANNGGFASVRCRPRLFDLREGDVLIARVRGDGREYSFNLYVARPQVAFSYRFKFRTKADEWIEIRSPLDKFEATSFGQPLANAGLMNPQELRGMGFLLGDKTSGPFRLEVQWIKVERAKAAK